MVTHILRDYATAASGYFSPGGGLNYFFTPQQYILPIFMHKVLGHSIVSNNGWDINNTNVQTFTASTATSVAAGSNGATLPQSTINVLSTTGFPASGTIYVNTGTFQVVKYSGTTATTFLNCSGGTGNMTSGLSTTIAVGSNNVALPTGTINVASTAGFPTSGTINVITTLGIQLVTYTGLNAGTQFTGCTGGTGTMNTGNAVTTPASTVFCGPLRISAATATINQYATITTAVPHGVTNGQYVLVSGVAGITTINGIWPATVTSPTQMTLVTTKGDGGTYTIFSGTLTPTGMLIASGTVAGGTGSQINISGAGSVYQVSIPTTVRTVVSGAAPTTGDVGRIMVFKSSLYPTKNSGAYKITAVDTVNNRYTIDYRSTDTPPNETMDWWLYEIETQVSNYVSYPNNTGITGVGLLSSTNTSPIQVTPNINVSNQFITGQKVTISGVTGNTAANGTWVITTNGSTTFTLNGSVGNGVGGATGAVTRIGYTGGDGYSFNSKVILQSPHATGWQSRIAVEPFNIANLGPTTVSVGYGGTSAADWPIGGVTSSIPQFIDANPVSPYTSNSPGNSTTGAVAFRMTVMGDDAGQTVFAYFRSQGAGANGILLLGIPSNEPSPLAPNNNRPFVYGSVGTADYGGIQMRVAATLNFGFTFRDSAPEVCLISGWANADGVSGNSPVYSANAGDSPFTGSTELLPWEIWGGIAVDTVGTLPINAGGFTVYSINQRFMGTTPNLRQGRTNFGAFALSTDSVTAFSVSTTSGTGVSPIQITTSASNALVTGQTVTISGVTGNTNANGTFVITVIDNTHFTLNGTTGNNNFGGGGTGNGTSQFLHLQNGIYMKWNGPSGLTP